MCTLGKSDASSGGGSGALLTVRDLHTYYGDSYVLQGVSLELRRGQVVAILGRNGMGKTTLIRSISGLTPARAGEIVFDGERTEQLRPFEIAQRGMALVPQGRRIFKNLSVRENLMLPLSALARGAVRRKAGPGGAGHAGANSAGNGGANIGTNAGTNAGTSAAAPFEWTLDTVLTEFPQLRERLANGGNELSGGEQQMLAIGRALMSNADLILMDEPSEGLSPRFVLHVGEIMARVKSLGHAILLVEQNLALALSVADYVHIISTGRFVFSGTPAQLQDQPEILNEHLGVSGAKPLPVAGAHA